MAAVLILQLQPGLLNLTMRRTDVFVHEQLRLTPLSVSACSRGLPSRLTAQLGPYMLVEHLRHEAPWLDCATHEQAMRRSREFFDAVIAAMTARAAALGQTFPPTGDHLATATAEGWIVTPDQPISALL